MAETSQRSDMATGLGLALGILVVLASIGTAASSYGSFVGDHSDTLQLLSGIALAVALIGGCLAVAAIHIYE